MNPKIKLFKTTNSTYVLGLGYARGGSNNLLPYCNYFITIHFIFYTLMINIYWPPKWVRDYRKKRADPNYKPATVIGPSKKVKKEP